jgi:hypothetical protein
MKKFVVLLGIPVAIMQDWMKNTDEAARKEQTNKMMLAWQEWMAAHESVVLDKGMPLGKTKRATAKGVEDIKNDFNWYLIIEAESHAAAAELMANHPHIQQIPGAYAEVMDTTPPMSM